MWEVMFVICPVSISFCRMEERDWWQYHHLPVIMHLSTLRKPIWWYISEWVANEVFPDRTVLNFTAERLFPSPCSRHASHLSRVYTYGTNNLKLYLLFTTCRDTSVIIFWFNTVVNFHTRHVCYTHAVRHACVTCHMHKHTFAHHHHYIHYNTTTIYTLQRCSYAMSSLHIVYIKETSSPQHENIMSLNLLPDHTYHTHTTYTNNNKNRHTYLSLSIWSCPVNSPSATRFREQQALSWQVGPVSVSVLIENSRDGKVLSLPVRNTLCDNCCVGGWRTVSKVPVHIY